MTVQALEGALRIRTIRTRMPFKYGIASMTQVPHAVLRLEVACDGQRAVGRAAESLAPKWFTKTAASPYRDDIQDMLRVIRQALDQVLAAGPQPDVFRLWAATYEACNDQPRTARFPALLLNLGTSLVERALLDAACRARGQTLAQALRGDAFGFQGDFFHPALAQTPPRRFLPAQPLTALIARHTVGLADPLWEREIPPAERLADGLPQSLEAVIRTYGADHFKIKIGGDVAADLARLRAVAALLTQLAPGCRFTLDGNEQYETFEAFLDFWDALAGDAALAAWLPELLFIEQPLHRDVAMQEDATRALRAWRDHPPVIVDESDGYARGLADALACGYQGTSHKNCKGVFKSVANAGLIRYLRAQDDGQRYVLSGEDLTNVGPIALLQDLAVLASLGIAHAERNGHHYFTGLSMFERSTQAAVLAQHADLYRWHAWEDQTCAAVAMERGRMALGSAVRAPFGYGPEVDLAGFVAADRWDPGSCA